MKRSLTAVFALIALAIAATTAKEARADAPDLMVVLGTGSAETQMMAMVLANQAHAGGASIRVLLCDEAGDLALAETRSRRFAPRDLSPDTLLDNLIDAGHTVEICAIYLPNRAFDESDLREGVGVAAPDDAAATIMNPDTRMLTF